MATVDDTGPTVFQRLARIRASVIQLISDTEKLHDSIKVPAAEGHERDETMDLRSQMKEAIRDLYSARDYFVPLKEHVDQVLASAVVIPFRGVQPRGVPLGRMPEKTS